MIIEKEIKIKLANGNRNHYKKLGYEFSKEDLELTVSTSDLPKSSRIEVEIICDYCGEKDIKTMREITKYNKNIEKDCCRNKDCKKLKIKEVNTLLYGTDSFAKLDKYKNESSKRLRTSNEDVLRLASSKNIEILNIECYKNEKTELIIICNNHKEYGIQKSSFQNIKRNKGCCCYGKNELIGQQHRLNENDVFRYFKTRNLIVEPDEKYTRKDDLINCRCVFHPDYVLKKSLNALENTNEPCEYCRNDKNINELSSILRNSIYSWRRNSEIECNYKCVLTGSDLYEVHHTYPFNKIIKEIIHELNIDLITYSSCDLIKIKDEIIKRHKSIKGVCLHPMLHKIYHSLYGTDENTIEQFDEFSVRYKNGDFKELSNKRKLESIAN